MFVGLFESFPKSCLERLFCRRPVAPASVKRTPQPTLHQEFSKSLKILKSEGCSLYVLNLLKRNSISELFKEIFKNFQKTFKKFYQELVFSSVATYKLQACNSKFLAEVLFRTYQCTRQEWQNAETSPVAYIINDSTTDALPAILETLANFWSEFSFQYSYTQVADWTAPIALKEVNEKRFSGNFPKLLKQQLFRNIA